MAAAAKPTNGFNKDKLQSYITRCETIADEAASEIGSAMKKKKDDTNEVLEEAKAEGIPTRPMKALLRRRAALRKVDEATAELSDEDLASFDAITESLGDWAEEVAQRAA
jgi:uncharacterized protein (UPF0335 family)